MTTDISEALGRTNLQEITPWIAARAERFRQGRVVRPPQLWDAVTQEIQTALGSLRVQWGADEDARAIVLGSTNPRFFCTGIDIKEAAEACRVAEESEVLQTLRLTSRHVKTWTRLVAAVEGKVVGGGLHFVVDADILVASEAATFTDTHVNLGFVGAVENIGLALTAGLGTALYLILVGRGVQLDAVRATKLGLVQEVVPSSGALQCSLELAKRIGANSPSAVYKSLEAVWSSAVGYEEASRYGWSLLQQQSAHEDFIEGPRAFAAKRAPRWGRR